VAKSKLFVGLLIVVGVFMFGAKSYAATCSFNGNYSFFFFSPGADNVAGVGYFTVQMTAPQCRAGIVVPGGIINCNVDGIEFEDYIEDGTVALEQPDGAGLMEIETNSSDGICGTGAEALELDVSVAYNGKRALFNTNSVALVKSGTVPNAGYDYILTGRAGKCNAAAVTGSYDIHFWEPGVNLAGDCTLTIDSTGTHVTGGTCWCSAAAAGSGALTNYLSEIENTGSGVTQGENCESSTGLLEFSTSSDLVCGLTDTVYLDFAGGKIGKELEIMGACDPENAFNCAFEGWHL